MAVRVAALNYTPYMSMQRIGPERYKCLDGEECKFMEVLSQAIDAKFEFLLSNDGGFGGFQTGSGNWNGNMKLLQQNKADIAPYMTYGYERWKVGIPSCPTHLTQIVFANLNPKPLSNAYAFFFTFELSAWWCVLASVLLCSCVLAILLHSNQKSKLVSAFLESYVSSLEIIFGMRSFDKIRGSKSAELFCTFVGLSMRILTFCFTAVFLAFLMSPLERPKIETYRQLGKAAALDQVKITVHGASFISLMLLNAPNGTMKALGDNIKKHSGDNKMAGKIYMEIIGDGYTIIDWLFTIRQNTYEAWKKNEVFISKDSLGMQVGGVFIRKGYKHEEKLRKAVIRLLETAVYKKIENDFIFRRQLESREQRKKIRSEKGFGRTESVEPISLADFEGIFLISAIMWLITGLVLFIEIRIARKSRI